MKRTLAALAAVVVMVMPALEAIAAMESPNPSPPLNGTAWVLSELPGRTLVAETNATLQFADGAVSGSDGCNRLRAPYVQDADGFRLTGNIASTMRACPEPVMEQAARFVDALVKARTARIVDGALMLEDAAGAVLATLAAQSRDLAGTRWQVTGYNNGREAVVSLLGGTTLTMAFTDDGKLGGSAGCNTYSAAYRASSQGLEIGPIAVTRKLCAKPAGVMEQEAAYLAALPLGTVVRIEGDHLELRSGEGALMVTATRTGGTAKDTPEDAGDADTPANGGRGHAAIGAHGLRLPATFRGDLPCADCEAIRHHLDLWPDQVFHLRRQWLGKPDPRGDEGAFFVDDIGRWRADPTRTVLILQGGKEMQLQYEIKGPDLLRQLDLQGNRIVSDLPYELFSDGTLAPTELALALGGEMQYLADAARFTEYLTGRGYPIAMEGDFVKMQRAYLDAASGPGAPLYVTFEGEIAPRPKMEGEGMEPAIVVRRFVGAWPGMRCERARAPTRR